MKYQIHRLPATWIVAILFACETYANVDLHISKFEIQRRNECMLQGYAFCDRVLVFPGTPYELILDFGPVTIERAKLFPNRGIYDSLNVSWVIPDKLIRVSWCSVPMGQGSYTAQADILAVLESNLLKEVFRDANLIYGDQGAAESTERIISYDWIPSTSTVAIETEIIDRNNFEADGPLGDKETKTRELRFKQIRHFKFEENKLRTSYPACEVWLDLGEKPANAGDVAEIIVLYIAPRWRHAPGTGQCTTDERKNMLSEMGRNESTECRGLVRIPTYEPLFRPLVAGDDYFPFGARGN